MKPTLPDGLYAAFDIGTHAVKAVIIERREGKDRLAAIEEENFKPVTDFPAETEFHIHQVQTTRTLADRLPLAECREILAIFNSRELQIKIVELPGQVQPDQFEGILAWEAKKLLSPNFRTEPFIFGYRAIRMNPPTVALSVIPQSHLQKTAELFADAKITISAAYNELFGVLAAKDSLPNQGLPALSIINIGHSGTHLQIFSAGELKFYRHIPSGIGDFSPAPQPGEFEVYSQKIRFSFDYFRAITKLGQIDEMLFMGGGATRNDYFGYAKDYFSPSRVGLLDISAKIDITPIFSSFGDNISNLERQAKLMPFLPAVSAYLAHADASSPNNNLWGRLQKLRGEERIAVLSRQIPIWIGVLGFIIILIYLNYLKVNLAEEADQAKNAAATAERALLVASTKALKLEGAQKTEVKLSAAEKSALGPLLKDHFSQAEVLFTITQKKPQGIIIKEISVHPISEMENLDVEETEEQAPVEPAISMLNSGSEASGVVTVMPPSMSEYSNQPTGPTPLQSPNSGNIEDLGGEILVVKGIAKVQNSVASFAEELTGTGIIKRYRLIQAASKGKEGTRFLLKGEMP